MRARAAVFGAALRRLFLPVLLLGCAHDVLAQVPCSGNAGGLNERRYSISPADISVPASRVTAMTFDAGGIVVTQQVQVIVDLLQETHLIALCLHADYGSVAGAQALATGDIEWRRLSPDPSPQFEPVSRSVPAPVLAQQVVGTLTAVYEFRIRLRWHTHTPGTYGTSLFWTAYRNKPNS